MLLPRDAAQVRIELWSCTDLGSNPFLDIQTTSVILGFLFCIVVIILQALNFGGTKREHRKPVPGVGCWCRVDGG